MWPLETKDWSNGSWKSSFAITEINYILKYIQLDNYFTLYEYITILQFYDQKILAMDWDFFQNIKKILPTPNFWKVVCILFVFGNEEILPPPPHSGRQAVRAHDLLMSDVRYTLFTWESGFVV